MTKHRNDGLRKLCDCPRRQWAKCGHPWHFSFYWQEKAHRFSLDRQLHRHVETKTEAETEADRIRGEIKAGTFGKGAPVLSRLTLSQLFDLYTERRLKVERPNRVPADQGQMGVIIKAPLPLPAGGDRAFGDWYMMDITADVLERFREIRLARGGGRIAINRNLAMLSALFNWAVRVGYLERTPFKRGTETIVNKTREMPRSRRLEGDEGDRLLAACGPDLRAIVEAALETGCRGGELLSLQWSQLRGDPPTSIHLPAAKTKTGQPRSIPVSTRLRAILEMRRDGPDGQPFGPEAYVFGNAIGQRRGTIKPTWRRAVLIAHGIPVQYRQGTNHLTPECQQALRGINLHFHDLRREAGSRWLDGGVPIMVVRDWLGHANVAQTSTYLASTARTQDDAMRRYEERLQTFANRSASGGRKGPQSAELVLKNPNQTAVGRGLPQIQ